MITPLVLYESGSHSPLSLPSTLSVTYQVIVDTLSSTEQGHFL